MGLLDKIFDDDKDKDAKKAAPPPASAAPASTPRADFSDVRGASSTTAPADAAPAAAARTYTVKAGDSLSKIAQRELGDASKWHAIYDANRDKISNPDLIHPGQVLTMPNA
jgi:nucleoid-associated protein YgaU